jgi:hypothetical protein
VCMWCGCCEVWRVHVARFYQCQLFSYYFFCPVFFISTHSHLPTPTHHHSHHHHSYASTKYSAKIIPYPFHSHYNHLFTSPMHILFFFLPCLPYSFNTYSPSRPLPLFLPSLPLVTNKINTLFQKISIIPQFMKKFRANYYWVTYM